MTTLEGLSAAIPPEARPPQGSKLVVGVSGGPDSFCLLDVLLQLELRPIVVHLDHQLRGESAAEARYVAQVAQGYGLTAIIETPEQIIGGSQGTSIEEAARLARYRLFVRVATEQGVRLVATGHTADDQVETILMHLLRGAGPAGLRGMLPSADLSEWVDLPGADRITLIRPLLRWSREEVLRYCRARNLHPLADPSNQDLRFYRNRLRHELLPLLESYNPAARQVLLRTGSVMAELDTWLQDCVDQAWEQVLAAPPDRGLLILERTALISLPLPVGKALMQRSIWRLRPDVRDIGYEMLTRMLGFADGGQRGQRLSVSGGLLFEHEGSTLLLREPTVEPSSADYPQLADDRPLRMEAPGEQMLGEGWLFSARLSARDEPGASAGADPQRMMIQVDAGRVPFPLVIRPARAGERIRPLGMTGSMKISDLLINAKVPRRLRSRLPLVCSAEQVIWVPGVRMAEAGKLMDEDAPRVELCFQRR